MTTNTAIWDGAKIRLLMDEIFFKINGDPWRLKIFFSSKAADVELNTLGRYIRTYRDDFRFVIFYYGILYQHSVEPQFWFAPTLTEIPI